jgi:two-component system, chemotaxis family, protein-glutamate methylesterase/glutaminase
MATRDLVVIGASAGGIEALRQLVGKLPADLPAAVLVVVHIPPTAESVLPRILSRSGPVPAKRAVHGEKYERGRIYVAPPDHHVMPFGDRLRLARGPRVNGHRPAIDPLFRAAARQVGPRAVGVILSGTLDDGTAGMMAIKQHGGVAVVQSPSDALYAAMPKNVLQRVDVDHTVHAAAIGELLGNLTREEIEIDTDRKRGNGGMTTDALELEEPNEEETRGPPSVFTCPDCHGALWELSDGNTLRYRCHVGHAFGPETLFASQSEALEDAVWAAYRALRESAMLAKRLGARAESQGLFAVSKHYELRHREAYDRAEVLRGVLERGELAAKTEASDENDSASDRGA